MKKIYLDNGASTMVDPKVLKAMMPYLEEYYGNASSSHEMGAEAHRALLLARETIAKSINAKEEEIIFTSGGTESNNMVVKGLFWAERGKGVGGAAEATAAAGAAVGSAKNHIVTTKIEHSCILNSCEWIKSQGAKVTYLDVDGEGFVDLVALEKAITPETFLVSVIHGNNEIGTVQDLQAIGEICRKKGVLFHTDACQSYTKVDLDVKKTPVDLVTLNSHKIHGPKGVGALYIRSGIDMVPLMHGGGHEKGRRGGTENVAGIVGFAEAVRRSSRGDVKQMIKMRDSFIEKVLTAVPAAKLNGPTVATDDETGEKRLANNVNIVFDVNGGKLGGYLNAYGVCTSMGSACNNNTKEISHVLKAIGRTDDEASGSIRFTMSRFTTEKELDAAIEILLKSIGKVRNSRF